MHQLLRTNHCLCFGKVVSELSGVVLGVGAVLLFQSAIDLARDQGNWLLDMRTNVAAAGVDFYHARFAAGAERGIRAHDIAREQGNVLGIAAGAWLGGLCLLALGELEQAEGYARAGLEPAERLRDRTWLGRGYLTNHFVCQQRGDFRAAREYAERGLAIVSEDSRLLFVSAVREAPGCTGTYRQGPNPGTS